MFAHFWVSWVTVKLKSKILMWKFGIGVLKQFRTTCQVAKFLKQITTSWCRHNETINNCLEWKHGDKPDNYIHIKSRFLQYSLYVTTHWVEWLCMVKSGVFWAYTYSLNRVKRAVVLLGRKTWFFFNFSTFYHLVYERCHFTNNIFFRFKEGFQ